MIDHSGLLAVLDYNPENGWFTWKSSHRGKKDARGTRAGWDHQNGYRIVTLHGRSYREHTLAWFYTYGDWPEGLDHINRVRDDNRIVNLRVATRAQNNANRNCRNSFGLRGVAKTADTWFAQITVNRKRIYLGSYPTAELAHEAYCRAAIIHYGEFASV